MHRQFPQCEHGRETGQRKQGLCRDVVAMKCVGELVRLFGSQICKGQFSCVSGDQNESLKDRPLKDQCVLPIVNKDLKRHGFPEFWCQ